MKKEIDWNQVTDEKIDELVRAARKKRNLYIILALIFNVIVSVLSMINIFALKEMSSVLYGIIVILGIIGMIFCGLVCFCINNMRYMLSRGQKQGGGFLWLIFFLIGGIIIPIIVVQILAHAKTSYKVLGWEMQ